jgi:hypothetical protein
MLETFATEDPGGRKLETACKTLIQPFMHELKKTLLLMV